MIKRLIYTITFPTNGQHLKGDISFQPGLTAVTGENGIGKTFAYVELPRYMLFGKQALRGPASDYKTLTAKMVVVIHGEEYTIERTPKHESVKDADGETLAVGAEAVNAKLRTLLRASLDVFDIVHAAVQKESDRISKLRPAARRQLIDKTVGLSSNEAVEKACKDEAQGLLREAEALRSNLAAPVRPEKPKGYRPSAKVKDELAAALSLFEQGRHLQGIVDACGGVPVPPSAALPDLADLETHEQLRLAGLRERKLAADELARLPSSAYTEAQLVEAEDRLAFDKLVAVRGPRPELTAADLEAWDTYFKERDLAQRLADVEVECPACDTKFCPGHASPIAPGAAEPTSSYLRQQHQAIASWAVPLPPEPAGTLKLTDRQIAEARQALANEDRRRVLLDIVNRDVALVDRSLELKQAREAAVEWVVYERELTRWETASAARELAEAELKTLKLPSAEKIEALRAEQIAAAVYESGVAGYDAAKSAYDAAIASVEDRTKRAEGFKLGAKKLAETRQLFKSYLAPSVSRIASNLIDKMTLGRLSSIIVDEDMNIAADGQDISTLSGAQSTVANLAVRLALGQVLTRGVFSVFIADEADSDMSEKMANATMEGLANLQDVIEQIIVITHKPVAFTDNVVTLQGND